MTTVRALPREEWARLEHTELGPALDLLPPSTIILVAERHGAIVGTWAAIRYLHVEGLWIAPAYRKSGAVLVPLGKAMYDLAVSLGESAVLTAAIDPAVENLLDRQGATELPGKHYVLNIEGLKPCL